MSSDRQRELLRSLKAPASALDYEIAQEMASALGRLGRALEKALQALSDFDQKNAGRPDSRAARRALVDAAAVAAWNFIVQREACGMRDTRQVVRDYRIPAEIHDRIGVFDPPPRRPPARR